MVKVELAEPAASPVIVHGLALHGLKAAVAPEGSPATLKVTSESN
jgi:hypothetical protein